MNRIVIILILLGSLFCLSGCIEVGYKTEVKVSLLKKTDTSAPRPRILDNGYPNSPRTIPSVFANQMIIDDKEYSYKSIPTISQDTTELKRRGFKKFKKREI